MWNFFATYFFIIFWKKWRGTFFKAYNIFIIRKYSYFHGRRGTEFIFIPHILPFSISLFPESIMQVQDFSPLTIPFIYCRPLNVKIHQFLSLSDISSFPKCLCYPSIFSTATVNIISLSLILKYDKIIPTFPPIVKAVFCIYCEDVIYNIQIVPSLQGKAFRRNNILISVILNNSSENMVYLYFICVMNCVTDQIPLYTLAVRELKSQFTTAIGTHTKYLLCIFTII